MEIKNVIGDNSPEVFEKLQGGTLINVQIEEVVTEGVFKYKYKQLFTTEIDINILENTKLSLLIKIYTEYLNNTDFYYPRFLETGESVPEEVVLKRTEAREYIRANTL